MKIARHFASWSIISGWITLNDEYFLAADFNKSTHTKTTGCHTKPHLWADVRSSSVSTDSKFLSVWPVMMEELPDILPEITARETGFLVWHPCTAPESPAGQEHCDVPRFGEGVLPIFTVETFNLSCIIPIVSARFSRRCLYFVPVRPFMFLAAYSATVNVENKQFTWKNRIGLIFKGE